MAEQVEQKESSSFRITYFPFSGRGGPLRLAAAVGGIAFEDKFITYEDQAKAKADGTRRWNGVPELLVLDKDGKEVATIGQSNACLRYIGNVSGTYPKGQVERALVDEVLDSAEDLLNLFSKVMFIQDKEEKIKARAELMKGQAAYWLGKFESRLEENEKRGNKNGFLVGDSITIADLKFFDVLNAIGDFHGVLDEIKQANKRVAKLMEEVEKNQNIAAFLEQFKKNTEDMKLAKSESTVYKYSGKFVPGAL